MKLIVGLGNPGRKYNKTRHNIGFYILDNYLNKPKWSKKFNSEYVEMVINTQKVIFVKPQTYMNLSGNSVKMFVDYYKISMDDILVIHDDKDLDFGKNKIKNNSSSGGHNGIESIIKSLGSKSFNRLKIGVGAQYSISTADFVLSNFSKIERKHIKDNLNSYYEMIEEFISK